MAGSRSSARASTWSCGTRSALPSASPSFDGRGCRSVPSASPSVIPSSASVDDMVPPHLPVLAEEVAHLLAPARGDVLVDCTFGAGGHAALLAPALGSEGLYVAIDRDPEAHVHWERFADEVACATRFVRANLADALPRLAAEG